jgi:uncharacterized protein (DUF488 family)
MTVIYTLGYGKVLRARVVYRVVSDQNLLLVDVRLSPRSRLGDWQGGFLVGLFGPRYIHVPEFGNINYKGDGPIKIKDLAAGYARVQAHLVDGRPGVVLLCGCGNVQTCHRKVVAEYLATQTGLPVQHLTPADIERLQPKMPVQLSLPLDE